MMCPKPPKPIRDKAHLAFVAGLPCCITGRTDGVQAHHLLKTSEKCMGRRSGDDKVIPLHHEMHTDLHRGGDETAFLRWYCIDPLDLARALYAATGDHEQGLRVVRGLERTG